MLTNRAMPGVVKIGRTGQSVEQRMQSLYTTGVPWPFECQGARRVPNGRVVEEALHQAFAPHRENGQREFFAVEAAQVLAILALVPGEDIVMEEGAGEEDVEAGGGAKQAARTRESWLARYPETVKAADRIVEEMRRHVDETFIARYTGSYIAIGWETGAQKAQVAQMYGSVEKAQVVLVRTHRASEALDAAATRVDRNGRGYLDPAYGMKLWREGKEPDWRSLAVLMRAAAEAKERQRPSGPLPKQEETGDGGGRETTEEAAPRRGPEAAGRDRRDGLRSPAALGTRSGEQPEHR